MYKLKTPFTSRRDNAPYEFTELQVPDVITVGMFRKVSQGKVLVSLHQLTEVCAGLSPFDGVKLESPDAVAYGALVGDLLIPNEANTFVAPVIRPLKALVARITVDPDQPVEFAAQVLQHSGVSSSELNAMDVRDFLPHVAEIIGIFVDPKP